MTSLAPAAGSHSIRPYRDEDESALIALWREAGLVVAANDPARDIEFCRAQRHATILVAADGDALVGTVMVGHDGHRGWLYYLATSPARRRQGIARRLMAHAEAWLATRGVPKVQLMIRPANLALAAVYERLGYASEPREIMAKRLVDHAAPSRLAVTITHLEMDAPPRLPAPPPPAMKLAVMRLETKGVAFYRYLYNHVGERWLWYERRRWTDEAIATVIGDPGVEVYVLYAAGEPAGFAELDRRAEGDVELAYFGLMPGFIGRGLGTWFMHWAVDAAWSKPARRLWVHTCDLDHPRAIANYQRAGFRPYRQETKEIDDPRAWMFRS